MTPEQRDKFERMALEFWRGRDGNSPFISSLSRLSAYVDAMIAQARVEEREACIVDCRRVADKHDKYNYGRVPSKCTKGHAGAEDCIAEIRARKDGQ